MNVIILQNSLLDFQDSVKSSNLSESIDGPDGWVDTLMQVAVCHKVSVPEDFTKRIPSLKRFKSVANTNNNHRPVL